MGNQRRPQHGITPPKGKPTRSRHSARGRTGVLGSTAQWVIVTLLLVVALLVIFILADGADFGNNNVPRAVGAVQSR